MIVFLIFLIQVCVSIDPTLVEYYETLIITETERALKYVLPKDASMYRPIREHEEEIGSYDFIIIGAGSSGTVIANRLSEIAKWDILLLEAGIYENDFTDIPSMTTVSLFSDYNWGFESVPQKFACLGMKNNICSYPRGKAIGGTTVINGLAYSRGNQKSFDLLYELGNPGWSFKEVFPYFLKSENFEKRNPFAPVDYDYHNISGPLSVEYHIPPSFELKNYIQANIEAGYNLTDINGKNQFGFSQAQINTKNGRRVSGSKAFIKPILSRKNLKILDKSYVTKIRIHQRTKEVLGVEFTRNRIKHFARVKKEVILSAGAISSPQILMLSGIGPKKHLREKNISLIYDLEVGSAYYEHCGFNMFFSTNYPLERRSLRTYIEEYLFGLGGLTAAGPNEAFGFYKTKIETIPDYPDLEIIFVPNYGNVTADFSIKSMNMKEDIAAAAIPDNENKRIFRLDIFGLHSRSTGTIRLKSKDPFEYPLIDPNLLSDKENKDIDTLYEGIQIVLKIIGTEAFKKIDTKLEGLPLPACKQFEYLSKDYWYCAIRQLGHAVNHPVGSCPMGPDSKKGAVVDAHLKVYGVRKLRVADASVFPLPITGHPNAPCVMVGEKVSDLIKLDYL